MRQNSLVVIGFVIASIIIALFYADITLAQVIGGGGEFGSRVSGLTQNLVNIVVPLIAILGLVYAGMLGATGDPGAKQRMVVVIIFSVVCFVAKFVIQWLQSAAGGGI